MKLGDTFIFDFGDGLGPRQWRITAERTAQITKEYPMPISVHDLGLGHGQQIGFRRSVTMSPMQIEMLLHFSYSAEPWPRMHAPACIEALEWFRVEDLVEDHPTENRVVLTERGKAHVHFLTMLPLPTATWNVDGLPPFTPGKLV